MKQTDLSLAAGSTGQLPMMPPIVSMTVSTTEARNQLSAFVNRAAYGNEAIVLSRHGHAEAVLVSMEFYQLCMDLLTQAE